MSDPVTMRRQLVAELRRLRADRGLTQRQVAEELDWSPSKIIRIEKAIVGLGVTDLQALLRLYGVADDAETRRLVVMARGSKRLPFNEYRNEFPAETLRFFRYESAAFIIRQFEPLLVPGLLQTEEYSRSLLSALGNSSERIESVWSARAERQELLDRDSPLPPEAFFILDEAVVRRAVGSSAIMRRQLDRLVELNSRPHISIQILPFTSGPNIGMLGPFVYLAFDETLTSPDVLYIEGALGDSVIRDEEDITTKYLDAFVGLEEMATSSGGLQMYLQDLS